jgi:hypothetical protein
MSSQPRYSRVSGAIVLLLLLIACTVVIARPGVAAPSSPFTVSSTSVGALEVTPSTSYAAVNRYLRSLKGAQPRATFDSGECRISSARYGLRFVLLTFSLSGSSEPSDCRVDLIELTGATWHTRNGLRVGDTLSRLRRLFPRAISVGRNTGGEHWARPADAVQWWLAPVNDRGVHTNLAAYLRNGRIIALVINLVGH